MEITQEDWIRYYRKLLKNKNNSEVVRKIARKNLLELLNKEELK